MDQRAGTVRAWLIGSNPQLEDRTAIKVFLAYPELGIMCTTRRLFELMTWTRELGLVMQVHCENGSLIEALVEQALREGRRGP